MDQDTAQIIMAVILFVFGVLMLILPGLIANKRNHPSKTAIWICCFLGPVWIVAFIWAFTGRPSDPKLNQLQSQVDAEKVRVLEQELATLRAKQA